MDPTLELRLPTRLPAPDLDRDRDLGEGDCEVVLEPDRPRDGDLFFDFWLDTPRPPTEEPDREALSDMAVSSPSLCSHSQGLGDN